MSPALPLAVGGLELALLGPLHSRAYWKREGFDDVFIRSLVNLIVTGAAAGAARPV